MIIWVLSLIAAISIQATETCPYPLEWWEPVTESIPDWEILPQSVSCSDKKVILSKRNELGILSNFAVTPFVLDSKRYASIEGFWQMMKYPEDLSDNADPRNKIKWPFTREQVSVMSGLDAKNAGKIANENLKKLSINWITYNGQKIVYKGKDQDLHYMIIYKAMREKLNQNFEVQRVLALTKGLMLLPDHKVESSPPAAYRYYDIWMKLREEYQDSENL